PDDQPTALAPAERFCCAGDERTDEIERQRGRDAKVIDLDVVNADLAVPKPVRIPAVRLLAQVLLGVVPMTGSDVGFDELVVPRALAELPSQGLARERAYLVLWLPMLNERVANIEEHSAKSHAAIVS